MAPRKKIPFVVLIFLNFLSFIKTSSNYTKEEWFLMFTNVDNQNIDFIFETKLKNATDVWSAFAFSTDRFMGNDEVYMCKYVSVNESSIERYYTNDNKQIEVLQSAPIFNATITYVDKILTCSFTRQINSDKFTNFFNLNYAFHILTATGSNINCKFYYFYF
jgi:hypothetical protein